MSDPTTPTTTTTTMPVSAANTQAALAEIANDVPLVKDIAAAVKKDGVKAILSFLPQIIAEGQKDYTAISAAIPEVKLGYKTTEFWMIIGATLLITVSSLIGHPLPVAADVVIGTLTAVYTLGRTIVKAFAPAAATTPTPTTAK